MYKHLIPIMATVRKWRGKICLAFLFRVSLCGIEAAYAFTAANKILGIYVFVHEVTMQSINSRRMIGDSNFK